MRTGPRTRNGSRPVGGCVPCVVGAACNTPGRCRPSAPSRRRACDSFAIFTTDAAGDTNNQNLTTRSPRSTSTAGRRSAGGGLTAGTSPLSTRSRSRTARRLMEIRHIVLSSDGTFRVQLYPFDTTTNPGNEYKVVVSTQADLSEGGCTKSDNFKVAGPGDLEGNQGRRRRPVRLHRRFRDHRSTATPPAHSTRRSTSRPRLRRHRRHRRQGRVPRQRGQPFPTRPPVSSGATRPSTTTT